MRWRRRSAWQVPCRCFSKTSSPAKELAMPTRDSAAPESHGPRSRREGPIVPAESALLSTRIVAISLVAVVVAFAAALVAQLLTRLIGLITNLAFYQKWSTEFVSPADNKLGALVVIVPIVGALVVGLMARYGSH